jgi:serine protease Do
MPFSTVHQASKTAKSAAPKVNQADEDLLIRASHAFNEIAQNAMPAVVSISTSRSAHARHPGNFPGPDNGMGPMPGPGMPEEAPEAGRAKAFGGANPRMMGIGSGIIIRKDGLILTNNHVIEDAERITVLFDEKHKSKAHVVGTDPKTDLALVQLDEPTPHADYPVISFGDSDKIREGDWAIAIGSPFGLNRSVSFGIISSKGRAQMGILDIEDFIQTDAAINPGSSGGPLLNAKGELVGINTAIFSEGGGNMGIGFAIPAKIAREISDEIIAHGRVARGWVGIMAQDMDADLARYFKLTGPSGALVSEVAPKGPAGVASLQPGDVITRFDHRSVDGAATLKSLVGKAKAGQTVPVDLVRDGRPQTVALTIQEQPSLKLPGQLAPKQRAGIAAATGNKPPAFGLSLQDVPAEISHLLHLSSREGTLVIGVNPGTPAFEAGLAPGDIILSANHLLVHGAQDFAHLSHKMKRDEVAVLFVQRGPSERLFVPVKLSEPEA